MSDEQVEKGRKKTKFGQFFRKWPYNFHLNLNFKELNYWEYQNSNSANKKFGPIFSVPDSIGQILLLVCWWLLFWFNVEGKKMNMVVKFLLKLGYFEKGLQKFCGIFLKVWTLLSPLRSYTIFLFLTQNSVAAKIKY